MSTKYQEMPQKKKQKRIPPGDFESVRRKSSASRSQVQNRKKSTAAVSRPRPYRRRRKKRKNYAGLVLLSVCLVLVLFAAGGVGFWYFQSKAISPSYVTAYETEYYNQSLYREDYFAQNLCVAVSDVLLDGYEGDPSLHAAGLFDVSQMQVTYADRIHDSLYPASTTKLMTAYLTLKYGDLESRVTVSEQAVSLLDPEAQMCGLQAGDQLSLYDLLCGLVLHSGNDNAAVIAEYLSGSTEQFVNLMNSEALALGATKTHFVNPHGLHDDNHYTTAYDLYLIFNACIQDERFVDIISMKSYNAMITGQDGSVRTEEWAASNYYSAGLAQAPPGVQVVGGKTGTTNEAGSCVVLYNINDSGKPYISIIMGADDKDILYTDMTQLLQAGAAAQ